MAKVTTSRNEQQPEATLKQLAYHMCQEFESANRYYDTTRGIYNTTESTDYIYKSYGISEGSEEVTLVRFKSVFFYVY